VLFAVTLRNSLPFRFESRSPHHHLPRLRMGTRPIVQVETTSCTPLRHGQSARLPKDSKRPSTASNFEVSPTGSSIALRC
jgi:hypothetical protein